MTSVVTDPSTTLDVGTLQEWAPKEYTYIYLATAKNGTTTVAKRGTVSLKQGVQLNVTPNRTDPIAGDSVRFNVTRENTGNRTNATLTVDGPDGTRTVNVDDSGTAVVDFDTAGDATVTVSKPGTDQVDYLNDTVDITVQRPGEAVVTNFSLTPPAVDNVTTVEVEDNVTITATVENLGATEASTDVNLTVNGTVVEPRNVTVAPDSTNTTEFVVSYPTAGNRTVTVNDLPTKTIRVTEELVDLRLTANPTEFTRGEVVNFTVTRNDTDPPSPTNATVTIRNNSGDVVQTVTIVNGTGNATIGTAGDYTATVTKEATPAAQFGSASVDLTVLQPAQFELTNFELSSDNVTRRTPVTANVTVTNTGDESGSVTVNFTVDGTVERTETISSLASGASRNLSTTFTPSANGTGTVDVPVAYSTDQRTENGTVTVTPVPTNITVTNVTLLTPRNLNVGGAATVKVDLNNTGSAGLVTLNFTENGSVLETRTVQVGQFSNRSTTFTKVYTSQGPRNLAITRNGSTVGSFTVNVSAVDTTPPGISHTKPGQGRVAYGANLSFVVTDNTDVSTVNYTVRNQVTGQTVNATPTLDANGRFTIDTAGLDEGPIAVTVTATDNASVDNTARRTFTFDLVSAPRVDSVSPTGTVGSSVTFDVRFNDARFGPNETGVNTSATELRINGQRVSLTNETVKNESRLTVTFTDAESALRSGVNRPNTATIVVVDNASHATARTFTFLRDADAPEVSLARSGSGVVSTAAPARLNVQANDQSPGSTTVDVLDSDGNVVYRSDVSSIAAITRGTIRRTWAATDNGSAAADGTYTVRVTSTDAFGNSANDTIDVQVDNTAPPVDVANISTAEGTKADAPGPVIRTNGSINVTAASETNLRTATVGAQRSGGRLRVRTTASETTTGNYSAPVRIERLPDGNYSATASVIGENRLPNQTIGNATIVLDTRDPSIEASLSVNPNDAQELFVNVSSSEPLADTPNATVTKSGNSTEVTLSGNGDNTTFNGRINVTDFGASNTNTNGTYQLRVAGTDRAGNGDTSRGSAQVQTKDFAENESVIVYNPESEMYLNITTNTTVNNGFIALTSGNGTSADLGQQLVSGGLLNAEIGLNLTNDNISNVELGIPVDAVNFRTGGTTNITFINESGGPNERLNTTLNDRSPNGTTQLYYTANRSHLSKFTVTSTDNVNPTADISQPTTSPVLDSTSTDVVATLNDTGTGVNASNVTVTLDSVDVTDEATITTSNGNVTVEYTASGLTAGVHTLDVNGTDEANNTGSDTVTFSVEDTAPTVDVTSPSEKTTFAPGTENVTIDATFGDSGTGINESAITVLLDGTDVTSSTSIDAAAGTLSVTATGLATPSDHNVTVSVADNATTTNSTTVNFSVGADTAPPTVEFTNLTEGDQLSNTTKNKIVAINVSDAGLGVSQGNVTVSFDGIDVTGSANTSDLSDITYDATGLSPGTNHTVNVTATDDAGNTTTRQINFSIAPDTQKPTVTVSALGRTFTDSPATLPAGSNTFNVTVAYADDASGVDTSSLSILFDGTPLASSGYVNSVSTNDAATVFNVSGLTNGSSHTVGVSVRDNATNRRQTLSTVNISDPTRLSVSNPQVSSSPVRTGETVTFTATVTNTGTVSDTGTFQPQLSGTPFGTSRTVSLNPGQSTTVSFTRSFSSPGTFTPTLNGISLASVDVRTGASFSLRNTNLSATSVQTGENVTVRVDVRNTGGFAGTRSVTFRANGNAIGTRSVSVGSGATRTVSVTTSFGSSGTYNITADGVRVGAVTVTAPPTGGDGGGGGGGGGGTGGGGDAGIETNVVRTGTGATVNVGQGTIGQRFTADLGDSATDNGVGLTGINGELGRSINDFRIEVTPPAANPPSGVSAVEESVDNARAISYFNADAIGDELLISEVNYTFSLPESELPEGTSTDQVVLLRYTEDGWTQLPTTYLGDGQYESRSPGFSAYAIGVRSAQATGPQFSVSEAAIDATTLDVGEETTVEATITNDGDSRGTFTAELTVDGEVVQTRDVTLDAGGSETVSFTVSFDEAGTYDVAVSGTGVDTVTVEAQETVTTTGATSSTTSVGEPAGLPTGLIVGLLLVIAVIAGVAIYRTRMQE